MKKSFFFLLLLSSFTSCIIAQKSQVEPVRGVWVTNVASNALKSKKNIKEAIQLCKKNSINNIYVVV